ncbi:MAG: SDR family NAD(P)-dependent oxidoreductase, partial [Cytophagaceae bacterium]
MKQSERTRPVAFVTGSSRGIGLGIAEHLARKGFDLAINGVRDESAVTDVLGTLRQFGTEVIYCQGSIADAAARTSMLARINKQFGQLNLLVNNAGIAPQVRADILEATEESFDQLLNVNLKGAYFLTQAVANWMIRQKIEDADFQASIITVSS